MNAHIEDLGIVGRSNDMGVDSKGNIYLTEAMDKAIKRVKSDDTIEILVQSDEFQWLIHLH